MFPVRYVHAADLHLDAAFKGLSREASGAELSARLRDATFTALERLFTLCEKEQPDFLVIAGDIYNCEDRSIKAQLRLRDGCERLQAAGVKVFLAHGNHDPLSSRLQSLHWPDNTIIFDDTVQSHIVTREGEPVAVVHGISYATPAETRNLAQSFHRHDMHDCDDDARRCFQLGVLHCTLDGMHAERYAPCSQQDLQDAGLDAWALGHVHQKRICSESPFVAYSGNIQGLHINEDGSRGCYLVSATPDRHNANARSCPFTCTAAFHPLGPVQWQTLTVNVENADTLDRVEDAVNAQTQAALNDCGATCAALLCRVQLTGRTSLDGVLRKPETLADLGERLRGDMQTQPLLWIKDIVVHTGQVVDMDALRAREDLLGETLRLAHSLRNSQNPQELTRFGEEALRPLYKNVSLGKALGVLSPEELRFFMDEAQRLCVDMMEAQ